MATYRVHARNLDTHIGYDFVVHASSEDDARENAKAQLAIKSSGPFVIDSIVKTSDHG